MPTIPVKCPLFFRLLLHCLLLASQTFPPLPLFVRTSQAAWASMIVFLWGPFSRFSMFSDWFKRFLNMIHFLDLPGVFNWFVWVFQAVLGLCVSLPPRRLFCCWMCFRRVASFLFINHVLSVRRFCNLFHVSLKCLKWFLWFHIFCWVFKLLLCFACFTLFLDSFVSLPVFLIQYLLIALSSYPRY